MMNFCEDCGERLSPGTAFCEECGARVPLARPGLAAGGTAKKAGADGIVYTNLPLLASQLHRPEDILLEVIQRFIADAASHGIDYVFVDASRSLSGVATVGEHLELIRSRMGEIQGRYLFILGSSSVVPSVLWENYASTAEVDPDISSDLPYATLDATNPFAGLAYDYDSMLRVGRLPNVDLENYFSNLELSRRHTGAVETFGVTARVWAAMTEHLYQAIAAGPKVLASPEHTVESVRKHIPCGTNLLLFNLHGSDETKYWYGQENFSYPEAVEPTSFAGLERPYFLAVEACYGAAYEGRPVEESVLLSALSGTCVSFLGSSRIAFGVPAPSLNLPKGCCADIVCGEFLRNLRGGMSAGDSLNMARKKLMMGQIAPEEVKTLAEFSLYGDPTASILGHGGKGIASCRGPSSRLAKDIRISQPDVRQAVRMELAVVEQKIVEVVEKIINIQYTEFKGGTLRFYRNVSRKDMLNAVVSQKGTIGPRYLIMDVSPLGQVKRVFESK
ncbi:MAG: zinc ribbon domain-containing protein [Spirochaetaceae bacterium]|nr:zinc ribbon domain-containing protein [Spirochaetaceae bacterium]